MKAVSKQQALRELRRATTRSSKYGPVLDAAEEEIDTVDDAVVFEELNGMPLTNTNVQGIRSYLNRHSGDRYVLRSRSYDTNDEGEKLYKIAVFLNEEDE